MINDDTTPGSAVRVTVSRSNDTLVITNQTNARIWTFAVGQQALITMLLGPS